MRGRVYRVTAPAVSIEVISLYRNRVRVCLACDVGVRPCLTLWRVGSDVEPASIFHALEQIPIWSVTRRAMLRLILERNINAILKALCLRFPSVHAIAAEVQFLNCFEIQDSRVSHVAGDRFWFGSGIGERRSGEYQDYRYRPCAIHGGIIASRRYNGGENHSKTKTPRFAVGVL